MKRIYGVIALVAILASACTFNSVEEIAAGVNACDTTGVTYSQTIIPIVESHCSDSTFGVCHQSGSPNGDFTTYAGLEQKVSSGAVRVRATVQKDMPPSNSLGPRGLPDCDIEKLRAWIDAGAPNN